jgi:hypothetical protein
MLCCRCHIISLTVLVLLPACSGKRAEPSASDGGSTSASQVVCAGPNQGDVTFSVPSGTFEGTLNVSLSTSHSGAEVRCTNDGTEPEAASPLYTTPISLTRTTRLRCASFVGGALEGQPSSALYVARTADATQPHDIAVIVLDAYGNGKLPTSYTAARPFVDVAFLAFEPKSGIAKLTDTPVIASFAAFHVRGNSSSTFDKTPYRIELRDETGRDRDCSVLGMPAEADWALVGPHADKTLIHNNFVYDLGRALGLQVPRIKLAEVYVNVDANPLENSDYQGVYQVVETIKNQKDRLNLEQLDESDLSETEITGGYIFRTEWALQPEVPEAAITCPSGTTNPWNWLELVDPMPAATQQMDYLRAHLLAFHNALHGNDPANPETGYPAYLAVRSFVDTVIVNELTRSLDAYARSQYYFKDRGEKINAGPLWDFDLIAGTGISTNYANLAAEGWQYEANAARLGGTGATNPRGANGPSVDWFPRLVAEPEFQTQLVARWKELRRGVLADSAIDGRIDNVSQGLTGAAERNFKKWNILTTKNVGYFETPTVSTWAGQIAAMKTWLQKRAAWLDTQWK